MSEPLLEIRNLSVTFPVRDGRLFRRRRFFAVKDFSATIRVGETFCLVGESGCGKTTLLRALLGWPFLKRGTVVFRGASFPVGDRRVWSHCQLVFQNPVGSLNPFLTLAQSVEEPMRAAGIGKRRRERRVRGAAAQVGLPEELLSRYPGEVSVVEAQRTALARALVAEPELLLLDEPISALDALHRKQIIDLLVELKRSRSMTYFLVTHNLGLVRKLGTTVAVMYLGHPVEIAPAEAFFRAPRHPYSQALLSNALAPGLWKGERLVLRGEVPSAQHSPPGCPFHPRCPQRLPRCEREFPPWTTVGQHHRVRCHRW